MGSLMICVRRFFPLLYFFIISSFFSLSRVAARRLNNAHKHTKCSLFVFFGAVCARFLLFYTRRTHNIRSYSARNKNYFIVNLHQSCKCVSVRGAHTLLAIFVACILWRRRFNEKLNTRKSNGFIFIFYACALYTLVKHV